MSLTVHGVNNRWSDQMVITGDAQRMIYLMGWSKYDEHVKAWKWSQYLKVTWGVK